MYTRIAPDRSADGRRVLLPRDETLVAHALDGSTPDQVLVHEADNRLTPVAWLADGRIAHQSQQRERAILGAASVTTEIKVLDSGGTVGRVVVPSGFGMNATPRELFRVPVSIGCNPRCYDVTDGPRLLIKQPAESVTSASVTRMDLVLNWTSTLGSGR